MVILETKEPLEKPRSVEEWVAQIKATWKEASEFKVDQEKLKHLAIICDGNRRAAKDLKLHPYFGHQAGVETIKCISRACRKWDIHTLTFWVWSTENWEREKKQVDFIMKIASKNLLDQDLLQELKENEVKFIHLGEKEGLPLKIKLGLENLEKETKTFNSHQLNLALNYGGLNEITRAFQKMFKSYQEGKFNPISLKKNPKIILEFLDTAKQATPDLIIRTGIKEGEIPHMSGFMPLQSTYSCWQFLPDLFPNLKPQNLLESIKLFQDYQRRFGR